MSEGDKLSDDASKAICEFMEIITKIAENNAITEAKVKTLTELIPVIRTLINLTTAQGIEIDMLKYQVDMLSKGKE